MPNVPQHKLLTIPVDVNWQIDIPSDTPGNPQVDTTDIQFTSIHLPDPPDEPQVRSVQVTNTGGARVICDLQCPDWIKLDQERLVLEQGKTREASVWIDPLAVNPGRNFGQIYITNSDVYINVTADVVAHGPAPQLETEVSISIPQTDDDYTYMLEIANVGDGELSVKLPTNIGDLRYKETFLISDKTGIPLTIPKSKLRAGETVTRDFVIRTNSVIERLQEIPVKFTYTVEAASEALPKQSIALPFEKYPLHETRRLEKRRSASTWVAVFVAALLTIIISAIGYYSYYTRNRGSGGIIIVTPDQVKIVKDVVAKSAHPPAEINEKRKEPPPSPPKQSSFNSFDSSSLDVPRETEFRSSSQLTPVVQPVETSGVVDPELQREIELPVKPELYLNISIYSYPRARVYIDGGALLDSRGRQQLTPLKGWKITAGKHSIKLVADNDPSRTHLIEKEFTADDVLHRDVRKGDW